MHKMSVDNKNNNNFKFCHNRKTIKSKYNQMAASRNVYAIYRMVLLFPMTLSDL